MSAPTRIIVGMIREVLIKVFNFNSLKIDNQERLYEKNMKIGHIIDSVIMIFIIIYFLIIR